MNVLSREPFAVLFEQRNELFALLSDIGFFNRLNAKINKLCIHFRCGF